MNTCAVTCNKHIVPLTKVQTFNLQINELENPNWMDPQFQSH